MDFRSTIDWVEANPQDTYKVDTWYIRRRFLFYTAVLGVCLTVACGPDVETKYKAMAMVAQVLGYIPFHLACAEGR